jgi:hypothetical protein
VYDLGGRVFGVGAEHEDAIEAGSIAAASMPPCPGSGSGRSRG